MNYDEITEMMREGGLSHVDRHRETLPPFAGDPAVEIWSFLFRAENRKHGSRARRKR